MKKTFLSNRGSTLLLVLGIVLIVSIMVIPLTLTLNNGLAQSKVDANYEQANSRSESLIVVYRRLLQEAVSEGLQNEDLIELAEYLETSSNLFASEYMKRIEVKNDAGKLSGVEVTTTSGAGPTTREKMVELSFEFTPATGGSSEGPGGRGDEFYYDERPTVKPTRYNTYFKVCDNPTLPDPEQFVEDAYPEDRFIEEFNDYIAYYQNQMTTSALLPLPAIEPVIPNGAPSSRSFSGAGGTIQGDIVANGNITFSDHTGTLTVNGNLLAKGNITFNGIGTLIVKGNIIAGGDITFNNWSEHITIEGSISGRNINYGGGASLTVGKWNTSTNEILENSTGSIIAGQTFKMNGQVNYIRVAGDFSSATFNDNDNQIANVRTGGSFLTGGSLDFAATFNGWIAGNFSVGQNFIMNSVGKLEIGKSLYVGNTLTFGNDITDLSVGGSLYSSGNLVFTNFISKLVVAGDLIVNGDMDFKDIRDRFQVGGILAIKGDLSFTNHLPYDEDINRFGGFYVGGTMDMPSWVNQNGRAIFCIDHNPPSSGGQSTIRFGKWVGN